MNGKCLIRTERFSGCNQGRQELSSDYLLFATLGFPRILKSPCASKENRFPKLNLPTVYQWNWRAKLAVNTQTPV
ncbi:MAG: hypothetical protein U0N82_13145, partial [Oscillospiraceae bacterium]